MPRIPDPDRASLPENVSATLDALPDIALFRAMTQAPDVFNAWLGLGAVYLLSLELSPRHRELAILAVAKQADCPYEWVQHVVIAATAGVTEVEIAAIESGDLTAAGFDDTDLAVLALTEGAVRRIDAGEEAMAAARAHLGNRQTVELLNLVGYYLATAIFIRSMDLEIDDAVSGLG